MANVYAVFGPPMQMYRDVLSKEPKMEKAVAILRSAKPVKVQVGSWYEMTQFYCNNELYTVPGASYSYWILAEDGEPEEEIYPSGKWLTILQSPKMHPKVRDHIDREFHALTSLHDEHNNFVSMSALYRGLERRIIAQVFTAESMPGVSKDTHVFRPMYMHIDPFTLARLEAMGGMERSDKAMETKSLMQGLPSGNVVPFTPKKE